MNQAIDDGTLFKRLPTAKLDVHQISISYLGKNGTSNDYQIKLVSPQRTLSIHIPNLKPLSVRALYQEVIMVVYNHWTGMVEWNSGME